MDSMRGAPAQRISAFIYYYKKYINKITMRRNETKWNEVSFARLNFISMISGYELGFLLRW